MVRLQPGEENKNDGKTNNIDYSKYQFPPNTILRGNVDSIVPTSPNKSPSKWTLGGVRGRAYDQWNTSNETVKFTMGGQSVEMKVNQDKVVSPPKFTSKVMTTTASRPQVAPSRPIVIVRPPTATSGASASIQYAPEVVKTIPSTFASGARPTVVVRPSMTVNGPNGPIRYGQNVFLCTKGPNMSYSIAKPPPASVNVQGKTAVSNQVSQVTQSADVRKSSRQRRPSAKLQQTDDSASEYGSEESYEDNFNEFLTGGDFNLSSFYELIPAPGIKNTFYQCKLCLERADIFENQGSFMKHLVTEHPSKKPLVAQFEYFQDRQQQPHGCLVCRKYFNTRTELLVHKKHHEKEQDILCQICSTNFSCFTYLYRHYRAQHPELLPYQCEYCFRRFAERGPLNKHVVICTSGTPAKEPEKVKVEAPTVEDFPKVEPKVEPPKVRTSPPALLFPEIARMMQKNDLCNGDIIECEVCSENFETVADLSVHHQLNHEQTKKIKCPLCDKMWEKSRTWNLKQHIKSVHKDYKGDFAFSKKRVKYKKREVRKTDKKKDFSFSTKIKGRKGVYKYRCPVRRCRRRYLNFDRLMDHMPSHGNKDVLKCVFCGYKCKRAALMKSHAMVHEQKIKVFEKYPTYKRRRPVARKPNAKTNSSLNEQTFDAVGSTDNSKVQNAQGVPIDNPVIATLDDPLNRPLDDPNNVAPGDLHSNLDGHRPSKFGELIGQVVESHCTETSKDFSQVDNCEEDSEETVSAFDSDGGEVSADCEICGRTFWTKYGLSLHMKQCHLSQESDELSSSPEKKLPFLCDECTTSFATKEELSEHILKEHMSDMFGSPENDDGADDVGNDDVRDDVRDDEMPENYVRDDVGDDEIPENENSELPGDDVEFGDISESSRDNAEEIISEREVASDEPEESTSNSDSNIHSDMVSGDGAVTSDLPEDNVNTERDNEDSDRVNDNSQSTGDNVESSAENSGDNVNCETDHNLASSHLQRDLVKSPDLPADNVSCDRDTETSQTPRDNAETRDNVS